MAKRESTFFNMFLALVVISALAAAILAYVNSVTATAIGTAKKQNQINALKGVLPPFEKVDEKLISQNGDTLKGFYAYQGNELVGVAIESYTYRGFSGRFDVMVGFLPNGNIFNTQVLSHKETPGLGSKMMEDPFKKQFENKNPATFNLRVKKDGGDVDAITAATISSRAFCDAAQRAYNAFSGNTDATSGATIVEESGSSKNADAASGATRITENSPSPKAIDTKSGATTDATTSNKKEDSVKTDATSGATTSK